MKFVGYSLRRREDERLLRGEGRFLADFTLPGMRHAVFVRSPLAHARITALRTAEAACAPGVHRIVTGSELAQRFPRAGLQANPAPARFKEVIPHRSAVARQPLMAADRARHVGEAVAVVIADTRRQSEDAAELVELDLDPLPALVDPAAALAAGAPLVHDAVPGNELGWFALKVGDAAAALARAPHVIKRRFTHHRYAAMPIECRGAVGAVEGGTYRCWSTTQLVHAAQRDIAGALGVDAAQVRCIALDVGGSFGVKGHVCPEDVLLPLLAVLAGCPVSWIEERREHLLASAHARDQRHEAEVGFDGHGTILAVRDRFVMDSGAYNPTGLSVAYNSAAHMPGPYRIAHLDVEGRIAATNKAPNAPYRGAGRPEGVQVMERLVDLVARELGLEPAEVRRRNMIRADEMPYTNGVTYRDGVAVTYDSGDYPKALSMALERLGGVDAFRKRQAAAREEGRRIGLGIGCYTEGTGLGPFEGASVRIDASGKVLVASGVAPQGQGMETVLSQLAADAWRVRPEDVIVTLGDTDAIARGLGTIASRTTVTVSGALHFASEKLRARVFELAAEKLECAAVDLELRDGAVGVVGAPGYQVSLAEVAREAHLQETHYFEPPTVTWAYAVHAAIVEVDSATGTVKVERYVVVHDCGTLVNPLLAEGQITGGVIQGIHGALSEAIVYDSEGQLLTGTLMDYALPVASMCPAVEIAHLESPSPSNPLGVKGLGEGGAIAPPAAIANAVSDALDIEINDLPVRVRVS